MNIPILVLTPTGYQTMQFNGNKSINQVNEAIQLDLQTKGHPKKPTTEYTHIVDTRSAAEKEQMSAGGSQHPHLKIYYELRASVAEIENNIKDQQLKKQEEKKKMDDAISILAIDGVFPEGEKKKVKPDEKE